MATWEAAPGAGHGRTDRPLTCTSVMDPLLDTDEAAELLSVDPGYIRRLVRERRIPLLKVGKFVRFDSAELEQWLEARRVPEVP